MIKKLFLLSFIFTSFLAGMLVGEMNQALLSENDYVEYELANWAGTNPVRRAAVDLYYVACLKQLPLYNKITEQEFLSFQESKALTMKDCQAIVKEPDLFIVRQNASNLFTSYSWPLELIQH